MAELTVKEALNIITIETINEENLERYNQAIEIIESAKARFLLIATECEDKLNEVKDEEEYIEANQWLNNFEENFDNEAENIKDILKDMGAGIGLKSNQINSNEYELYLTRINETYNRLKLLVEKYEKSPNNIFSRNFTTFGIRRYTLYKLNKEKINLVKTRVAKLNNKSNVKEEKTNIYNESIETQNEVKKIYVKKLKDLSEKLGINFNIVKQIITMKIPEKFDGKEYLKKVDVYVKDGGDPNVLDFDLISSIAEREIASRVDENQITFEDILIEEPEDDGIEKHDYNDYQNR